VPRRADPGATGICGQICGDGLDCASQRCDSDAGIVGVCKDPGAPCDKNHPCSWGQICSGHGVVSRCRWATELAAATRGPCASDGDCGAGLKCFKRDGATAPRGRCEMLCSSAQMTCTGAHQCSDEGICEWLGE
jgi:hypothetical protein